MVMLLVQRQADVNTRDALQRTAQHISAAHGYVTICDLLLDNGAQLESRGSQSKTALQLTAEAGHFEVVERLLKRSNLKPNDAGFLTAFYAAVEAGQVRIAESFLSKGVSLKGLKNDSHRPVTLAAKSGNLEMLDIMITRKCRIKEKDANGSTALHFAAHHGHPQVIIKAVTAKKETPLHLSVKGRHFAATEILLRSKCAPISLKDSQGQEPLHFAVRDGLVDIVNLLLSSNASIATENTYGWRPVHIAIAYGHTGLVEQLFSRGASIEEKLGATSYTKAQAHTTVESRYRAEARWPYPGSRLLHLSVEYDRDDITRFLINKGAKVKSSCSEGWRPLHHAAFNGNAAIVELLLEMDAYVHAVTDEGTTPLGLGFRTSGDEIVGANKLRVQELLHVAMAATQKQVMDQLKGVWQFKAKTVEDKDSALRAAALAVAMIEGRET